MKKFTAAMLTMALAGTMLTGCGSTASNTTTDDSAANSLKKGEVFSYTATGDTLADIDTYSSDRQKDMFVKEYDKDSGDITLVYNIGTDTNPNFVNATNTDAWNTVDSKDTVLMFVGSDDGEGLTGYTMDNITLANVFDADKWSDGQSHTTFTYNATNKRFEDGNAYLNEDFAPNVHVFVDNDSDDQITVLVIDVPDNNITKW